MTADGFDVASYSRHVLINYTFNNWIPQIRFGFLYIMASGKRCTIYTGVTSDLAARVHEHKTGQNPNSFTGRTRCARLVYYERYDLIVDAIAREKQLKHWNRQWKLELIEAQNPDWQDLQISFDDYERS